KFVQLGLQWTSGGGLGLGRRNRLGRGNQRGGGIGRRPGQPRAAVIAKARASPVECAARRASTGQWLTAVVTKTSAIAVGRLASRADYCHDASSLFSVQASSSRTNDQTLQFLNWTFEMPGKQALELDPNGQLNGQIPVKTCEVWQA